MDKQAFLNRLREGLNGLPQDDIAERLNFYSEMIDDRVEEGLTEEAAVNEIGPVDQIAAQILRETPITKLVREKVRPNHRLQVWEIILLVLGAPIWLSLLVSAAAVVLSVYVVLWAVILSLWAVEISIAVSALAGIGMSVFQFVRGQKTQALAFLSVGTLLAGLSIFLFFGCMAATEGILRLTKKIALWVKSLFLRKENAR
ncbi:MAG: DUF1700 domain-containing protein [Oscillospiraceae bacterium]|nr:DUF1700 domain-containing protein [Oscillospiraceae bacterium]